MLVLAVALALAFVIQAFFVKPYEIPSGSMEPTLAIGQRVLVDRIGMDFSGPGVGDIVVFHPPKTAKAMLCGPRPHRVSYGAAACDSPYPKPAAVTFIKRIVAGPGDWMYVEHGEVFLSRTGRRGPYRRQEASSYTQPCGRSPECSFPVPIHIPAGHWFMMGDNRGDSDDSRFWGPVPTSWIIGVAFATYWPPDRIGFF